MNRTAGLRPPQHARTGQRAAALRAALRPNTFNRTQPSRSATTRVQQCAGCLIHDTGFISGPGSTLRILSNNWEMSRLLSPALPGTLGADSIPSGSAVALVATTRSQTDWLVG